MSPEENSVVSVVDDDAAMRDSLRMLLSSSSIKVETYPSGAEFLTAYDSNQAGCLVLDVSMPGMSGIDVQDRLLECDYTPPIVFFSGHGDIPMAVRAMQRGAVTFLPKPIARGALVASVKAAFQKDLAARKRRSLRMEIGSRIARLTRRERQVLDLMFVGRMNKAIAYELGISERTVEKHRAQVKEKLGADSIAELVHLVGFWRNENAPS